MSLHFVDDTRRINSARGTGFTISYDFLMFKDIINYCNAIMEVYLGLRKFSSHKDVSQRILSIKPQKS